VDYIHCNPVKHDHVTWAADWPYSSIYRYIEAGMMLLGFVAHTNLAY
jgi:putative transposase